MKNTSKYAGLTRDQAIAETLKSKGLWDSMTDGKILEAMQEAFREGWLRGEEYASNVAECATDSETREYIKIPVYSEEANEDGSYDILTHKKEYV
jgi:hypothetical protein